MGRRSEDKAGPWLTYSVWILWFSPQESYIWGDTHKAEDNIWHLVFQWDLGIFSLIWQGIISRPSVVVAAELGSGSGNCPSPIAMFLAACIGLCPRSVSWAIWEPDSVLSACTVDPSSFPQQTETHSYLLKPPELPAWQCCQLSLVPGGGSHSPCALGPWLLSAAQMGRYPCMCWLEVWGNLFHEGESSNSCLYCRDLSVGSQEALWGPGLCWQFLDIIFFANF